MAVERILNIDIKNRGLFTALYGHYDDVFVGDDLRKYNLWQQLYLYLKAEGYDCVLFYDTNNGFHSYSQDDLLLFLNQPTNATNVKNSKRKRELSSHIKSPLRPYRLNQEDNSQQTTEQPQNTSNNIIQPIESDGLNGYYKLYSLANQLSYISQLLKRTNIRTTLIIKSPLDANFSNQELYRILFEDLYTNYDNHININKILILYGVNSSFMLEAAFADQYNMLFCSSFFKEKFIESEGHLTQNVQFIGLPNQDEIGNLLNRFRFLNNYAINFLDFVKILNGFMLKKTMLKEFDEQLIKLKAKELTLSNLLSNRLIASPEIIVDVEVLERNLNKVIGQNESTPVIIDKLKTHFDKKTRANPLTLFLVGTSGVGKTFTAELTAKSLEEFGFQFVEFRMTEFQKESDVWKLIGSSIGYVGSTERPRLFQKIKENERLVILFDEIEKAHGDIIKTLLQLLGSGKLSWNNEEYNFKDCIIIFTSNAEREQFVKLKNKQLQRLDKNTKLLLKNTKLLLIETSFQQDLKDLLTQSDGGKFSTEFCGRINTILVYSPLKLDDIIRVTYTYFIDYIFEQTGLEIRYIELF